MRRTRGRATAVSAAALVATLAFGVLMAASYVGALHDPRPRDVRVAVAGGPSAIALVERVPGLSAVPAADARAARRAVARGEAPMGLAPGPAALQAWIASASGRTQAVQLTRTASALGRAAGLPARVTDVAPLPPGDSSGLSSFYAVLALVVGGYLGATFLALAAPAEGDRRLALVQLGLLVPFSALLALATGLVVDQGFGALPGDLWTVVGVGTLVALASSVSTYGLERFLGIVGTGLVLVAFVALGNPSSGGPSPPGLLAEPWRAIGDFLPPGAGTTALRNLVYFDGAGTGAAFATLSIYAVIGAALAVAFAGRRPLAPPPGPL